MTNLQTIDQIPPEPQGFLSPSLGTFFSAPMGQDAAKRGTCVNPQSNMRRVLHLVQQGYVDRQEMADMLNITKQQVNNAIENLVSHGEIKAKSMERTYLGYRKGRGPVSYQLAGQCVSGSSVSGISFVFWLGGKG